MATYVLPTVITRSGTLKVTIDCSTAGLTVPTRNTIKSITKFPASLTDRGTSFRISSVDMELMDDYTNYPEGFWYKLLRAGDVDFKFELDEGAGYTYLWEGRAGKDSHLSEILLADTNADGVPERIQRYPKITIYSALDRLRTVSIDAVTSRIDTVYEFSGSQYDPTQPDSWVKLKDIIIAAMDLAYGGTNDVHFLPSNRDFYFSTNYTDWYGWDSLITLFKGGGITLAGQWNPATDRYYGKRYSNALEMVGNLARNFGFSLNYHDHVMDLLSRRRGDTLVTLSAPRNPASLDFRSDIAVRTVRIVSGWSSSEEYLVGAPGEEGFDLDVTTDYSCSDSDADYDYQSMLAVIYDEQSQLDGNIGRVRYAKYYDHQQGVYVANYGLGRLNLHSAVANYYIHRFPPGLISYPRSYRGIKATTGGTTTHSNMSLFAGTQMHDGQAQRYYFAADIGKDVFNDLLNVEWWEG